jgi:iron complex transport system permease protein
MLLVFLIIVVSGIGTVKIPLKEIVSMLRGYGNPTYGIILLRIRLPRIIQSAVVGIGLSVSGAFFQGLLANPLADPYILGVSSGAALGATLSIMLGLGLVGTEILAFATALATIYLVISLSKIGPRTFAVTMLLAGIAVSTFLSSIISFMMLLSDHKLANIVFWMMGGFNLISWKEVLISTPVIIGGTFFMYLFARDLNAIAMGEETAEHLGVDTEKVRRIILACGSLVTATAVSVSGIVGFVGLMIPHITRLLVGPDNRILIPYSAVIGAIFLVFTDTISRTIIQPTEIPIGIITAAFGGPFFLYILKTNRNLK